MIRAVRTVLALAGIWSVSSLTACTTYRDQLVRSQQSFEQNDYERAVGLLRALEPDVGRLEPQQQARYAYLRGMADYRIGQRADARHWLAIAKAQEDASAGMLPIEWKSRMNDALDEMNSVVYGAGLDALATTRKPGEDAPQSRPPLPQ